MSLKCAFCDAGGPLVRLVASRSDTDEVLDDVFICPECFYGSEDLRELFPLGVVVCDAEGVAGLAGRGPDE
jgi:hypothetical protein